MKERKLGVCIILCLFVIAVIIFEGILVLYSVYSLGWTGIADIINLAIVIISHVVSICIVVLFCMRTIFCFKNNTLKGLVKYIVSIIFLVFTSVFLGELYLVATITVCRPRVFYAIRYFDDLSKAVLACQIEVEDITLIGKEITPPEATSIKITCFEPKDLTKSIIIKKDGKELSYGPYLEERYGDNFF
ncbi:hypothetical protein [Acetivibrio straminisolvens]|uniref:hypothetical protein n=1 Tax=Acetivibrio straminisolvens TaxID=253314 RepID=UPI001FB09EE3|nr:hypothetical protein [Acetivibrio straminisolvens]